MRAKNERDRRVLEFRAGQRAYMSLVESLPHNAAPSPAKTPHARIGVRGAGKSYGALEVFRNINLPPFKRDSYISTLQRSTAAKIARGIQLTAATDLAIKTSQATPRLQLELLVCELAS